MFEDEVKREDHNPDYDLKKVELTSAELNRHFERLNYGDFEFTGAVLPHPNVSFTAKEFYRWSEGRRDDNGERYSVLLAVVSAERVLELFYELVKIHLQIDQDYNNYLLPVDFIIDSSHRPDCLTSHDYKSFYRERIDWVVLQSILIDYEDIMLKDGFAGFTIKSSEWEVQFDEHKLFFVFGNDRQAELIELLEQYGIYEDLDAICVKETKHIHNSFDEYRKKFEALRFRLGAD